MKQHIIVEITHEENGNIDYKVSSDMESVEVQAQIINLSKMILDDYESGSKDPRNLN